MSDEGFRPGFRLSEHKPDAGRDVNDEIAFHLAMRERELVESGMSPEEAHRMARESFGSEARVRAECARIASEVARSRRAAGFIESVLRDVRHGLRGLRRSPVFAVVAVLTLALGIGGNAVVFSLVEAVLLRSPAVRAPDRLATVWTTCRAGDPRCSSSYPDFIDYRDRSTRLEDLAAYTPSTMMMDVAGAGDVVGVELVSGNYFELLGVASQAGRLIQPSDEEAGGDASIVVLSERYWRTRLGADPGVVGRSYRIDGIPHVVIGIAKRDFEGLDLGRPPDLWMPLANLPVMSSDGRERLESRGSRWIGGLVGRLSDGATVEGLRAEMLRISDALREEDPQARGPRTVTVDAMGPRVGYSAAEQSSFLGVLQGAVLVTLLLACANLANLYVARATARRSEMGVRLALGVGRARLVRQMLTESLLMAALGGLLALVLAAFTIRLIGGVTLPGQIAISEVGAAINAKVVLFVASITGLAGLLFGGTPALVASRASVASVLRESRGETGGGVRLRSALVAVQIGLGVVLLVGAALFVRTLRNRLDVDLGFPTRGLALITIDPTLGGFPEDRASVVASELVERLGTVPGVVSAAATTTIPVRPGGLGTFATVDGYEPQPDEEMRIEYTVATRGYVGTLGLPVVSGMALDNPAALGQEEGILIDETMARRWWPAGDALGGRVRVGASAFTVVGIVRRSAWGSLDVGDTPFVILPATPGRPVRPPVTLVVRTDGEARRLLPALLNTVRQAEPQLAIRSSGTLQDHVSQLLGPQLAAAWLLSGFGALALILAAIGIYGVVAYTVTRRRRDLSIRLALGATGGDVVRQVARGMFVPVAFGIGAGVLGARALTGTVTGFMYGVSGTEPGTYLIVAAGLAAIAVLATLLPARRAALASPVEAMRSG